MSGAMSISVIIPAYNRESYLAGAIESVLSQTYPAMEIIVVDDGSTDGTAKVARAYGERVHYIRQENSGAGAARNAGLARARGSLIAFLDSDDLWLERKLEAQATYLEANPGVDLVFCHMKPFLSPELDPKKAPRFDERTTAAANVGSMMVRREVFAKAGLFPTARNLPEFFPWYARVRETGMSEYTLPELLLLRRVHLTNMVHDPGFKLAYVRYLKQRLNEKRASVS